MAYRVTCPRCGRNYKIRAEVVGKRLSCKACDEQIDTSQAVPLVAKVASTSTRRGRSKKSPKTDVSTSRSRVWILAGGTIIALIVAGVLVWPGGENENASPTGSPNSASPSVASDDGAEFAPVTERLVGIWLAENPEVQTAHRVVIEFSMTGAAAAKIVRGDGPTIDLGGTWSVVDGAEDRVDVNFEQGGGEVEIDWQSASQMVMTPVHAKTGELRTEQAMTYRRLADRSEIPPIRATAEPLLAAEDLVGTWRLKLSYSDVQIADMRAKYPERAADWTDDALAAHVDQHDSKTVYEFREDGTFELRGTGDSSDVVRPGRYEVVVIEDATRLVLYFDGYGHSQTDGMHVVAFEPDHVLIQLVRGQHINEGFPAFDQYELIRMDADALQSSAYGVRTEPQT